MDPIIFSELARAWRARVEESEKSDQACPEGEDGAWMVGNKDGEHRARRECAYELERVLQIYSPLRD